MFGCCYCSEDIVLFQMMVCVLLVQLLLLLLLLYVKLNTCAWKFLTTTDLCCCFYYFNLRISNCTVCVSGFFLFFFHSLLPPFCYTNSFFFYFALVFICLFLVIVIFASICMYVYLYAYIVCFVFDFDKISCVWLNDLSFLHPKCVITFYTIYVYFVCYCSYSLFPLILLWFTVSEILSSLVQCSYILSLLLLLFSAHMCSLQLILVWYYYIYGHIGVHISLSYI